MPDTRQLDLIQAIAKRDSELRADGRPSLEFSLLLGRGGPVGLKPPIEWSERPPSLAEIEQLEIEGFVSTRPSNSASVAIVFELTSHGRALAPRPAAEVVPVSSEPEYAPLPTQTQLLKWISTLAETAAGQGSLADGNEFIRAAVQNFGIDPDAFASRALDLQADGLLRFEDPLAQIDQATDQDRLGDASDIRLTVPGERIAAPPDESKLLQIVNAVHAQVAGGDVTGDINVTTNITFNEFLDQIDDQIASLQGITEEDRAEARGMIEKMRAGAGRLASGTATSAAGAVVGALLKEMLGLP